MAELSRAPKGLEHVVLGQSSITLVAGETGGLTYRGFDLDEVVGKASYEALVHLLLRGEPPSASELVGLRSDLARRRTIGGSLASLADAMPPELPALDALRTAVSGMAGPSFSYPPTLDQGLELIAKAPTLLTRIVRRRAGAPPVEPDPSLGHVANYLYMLTGTHPSDTAVSALESYFLMLADHGMNASTFALRVALSTNADLLAGASAGLATLQGPLHGGAPAKVSDMLDAIGSPEAAATWIDAALARKERLMGFGHRAYKTEDPRAVLLHRVARATASPDRLRLAETVEAAAIAALRRERPGQRLYVNVEYWGAVVLEAAGLPRELFTPTFALARTAGWTAHALEQASDNRLIRPEVEYTGPAPGRRWPTSG